MFDGALFLLRVNAVLPRPESDVCDASMPSCRVTFVTHTDQATYQHQTKTPYINHTRLYNGAAYVMVTQQFSCLHIEHAS